jgi:hypothetical protein
MLSLEPVHLPRTATGTAQIENVVTYRATGSTFLDTAATLN